MFVVDLKEGLRILEFVGFRVRLPLKLDQGEVPTFTEEEQNSLQTYIVFLEKPVSSKFSVEPEFDGISHFCLKLLQTQTTKLKPEEVKAIMETKEGFLSAHLQKMLLDTGIGLKHPSFSDEGVSTPPAKWKGKCDFNGTVCNNKLIGAQNFVGVEEGNITGTPFD
ncbi:hypothetical protein ACFX2J_037811 [Malus domestica]